MAVTKARQLAWRVCYEAMARFLPLPEWAFMNYGFAADAGTVQLELEAADEPDRLCIQLYDHVIGHEDLAGLDLLEVGSGRGGGASYLRRCRGLQTVTGVDLARRAVALSRRHRGIDGLRFVQGDASDLPFPDDSFDIVINVESSHCYPSMGTFLSQVARVLRPGGFFAYADFRLRTDVPGLLTQLENGPLALQSSEDITPNVLAALRADDDRKSGLIDTIVPRPFRKPFRRFAGMQGSSTYARFQSGELRYLCARLAKR